MGSQPVDLMEQARDQQKTQPAPQPQGNETPIVDTPRYTEKQWSDMRRSMQKQINDAVSRAAEAESRVEETQGNVEALQDKIVTLTEEAEAGIPEDSKQYATELRKRSDALKDKERKFESTRKQLEAAGKQANDEKRHLYVDRIVGQFDGITSDQLDALSTPEEMNSWVGKALLEGTIKPKATVAQSQSDEKLPNPGMPILPSANEDWRKLPAQQQILQGLIEKKK